MTAPALVVARKDFEDAARSKLVWGLTVVLLVATVPYFNSMVNSVIIDGPADAVGFIPLTFQNYVAPLSIIVAYRAVVGERESGSLRVLFGHPVTRRDFVVGKLLSRIALLAAVLLTALLAIGVLVVVSYGTIPFALYGAMILYTLGYGAVWAAVTVGVSAAVSSRLHAITALLGLFLFFGPFHLWSAIGPPLASLLTTGSLSTASIGEGPHTWPIWYSLVERVNPISTFDLSGEFVASLVDPSAGYREAASVYLVGFGMLLAWGVGFVALGLRRFERSDIA